MDLIVHVPVLSAISEINFSKKDRTAAISVRHHNTLGGIRMIGVLKEANEYGHETKPIRRTPISLQASTDTGGQFTSENAMVTLPITKETAMIDFRLSIANMGVVHERRQTVIEPPIRYTGEQAISWRPFL